MLLSQSDHRLLSRRLLPYRTRRHRTAYRVRESHAGVSRLLCSRWKWSCHAASGMGLPRPEAWRQMVCLRHALEKRLGSQSRRSYRSWSNARFRARIRHVGRTESSRAEIGFAANAEEHGCLCFPRNVRTRLNPSEFAATLTANWNCRLVCFSRYGI